MKSLTRRYRPICLGLLVLLSILGSPVLFAQQQPTSQPVLQAESNAVRLHWAEPQPVIWARQQYNQTMIDVQLLRVWAPAGQPVSIVVHAMTSVPLDTALEQTPPPIPQTLDGALRPELASRPGRLPAQPVWVLRDDYSEQERLVVIAVSRMFDDGNGPRRLTSIDAQLVGVGLSKSGYDRATMQAAFPAPPAPTNPVALTALARLTVTSEGLQQVTGSALASAGIALNTLDPARLQVVRAGNQVALELVGMGDGHFDSADILRFYAGPPGNRWNATDSYWLVLGTQAGLRMQTRSVLPATSAPPLTTVARERGAWREARLYDTTQPGPLGDYWYTHDLKIDPSSSQPAITITVNLTPTLPLAPGTLSVTLAGAAYTSALREVRVAAPGASQSQSWSGIGSWTRQYSLANNAAQLQIALQRSSAPHGLELQGITYTRPVTLTLAGRGARFEGWADLQRYRVSGAAGTRQLYDVTTPGQPQILTIPAGASFDFDDQGARSYMVSGPGMLQTPTIIKHMPVDLRVPLNANTLYIAPQLFHAALAPLIAQRQKQGYQVRLIDVQSIYDAWSDGQIDPEAIRSFLRYANANTALLGVTLVGDGTADPRNYARRNNTTFIPPYLAHVDPWLGETACESCYAQLDGVAPLDDGMPDIALGRLPVKNADELTALVQKIVSYETGPTDPAWQSRMVLVADNYHEQDGRLDNAGDFAAQSDAIAGLAPRGVELRRLYFDPWPGSPHQAWREPDPKLARQRTMDLISQGAALVSYVGHSSQFQWAVTDPNLDPSSLLGLYDTDLLQNDGKPAVVRELTCLTAAFHTPAYSGTSIDERLLLAKGGAVAVWGPTGFGVSYGHDALARGFDQALWQAVRSRPAIGALALAGFQELRSGALCCQNTIWTYALLGDPLTPVRVEVLQPVFLPVMKR